MRIFYNDQAQFATLTASSVKINYNASNVIDKRLSRRWHTEDVVSENIVFDGSATCSFVAILQHNFTSSAIIKFQGNNTDVWTSPSLDETLTWTETSIISTFTEVTYNYYRVLIEDPTNTDTYLEVGRVMFGDTLVMPAMSRNQGLPKNTTGQSSFSESGQVYGNKKKQFRSATIRTPFFNWDKKSEIENMWSIQDVSEPIILEIWENQTADESAIYCTIQQNSMPFSANANAELKWSCDFTFREVF